MSLSRPPEPALFFDIRASREGFTNPFSQTFQIVIGMRATQTQSWSNDDPGTAKAVFPRNDVVLDRRIEKFWLSRGSTVKALKKALTISWGREHADRASKAC
jgi:hypothetical protein